MFAVRYLVLSSKHIEKRIDAHRPLSCLDLVGVQTPLFETFTYPNNDCIVLLG